jgi:SAM-dependent methyltransferase
MHRNSQLLFEKHALAYFKPGIRVLEIGPGAFPSDYQKTVGGKLTWDTLDIYDSPSLTYPKAPLYEFPIPTDSYDVVLSGQVIEHVGKIWRWMAELARVTRPGGCVITIGPASWPFHEYPIDCWRIFPDGMKALSEDCGLAVEKSVCESLELPGRRRAIPGRSPEFQNPFVRWTFGLLGVIGFPIEKSFDTITIARKPMPGRGVGG